MKPNLDELVAKWQKILRLQDWDVSVKYARHFDFDAGKQGHVQWIRRLRQARIKILDPQDFAPEDQYNTPPDPELTVVHELLHIHWALIDDEEGLRLDLHEQAIEAVSRALVALDRQTKP